MTDRIACLLIIVGALLMLPGCCASLLRAYEADSRACLVRFDSPEHIEAGADIACVYAVREMYRPVLEAEGCDD